MKPFSILIPTWKNIEFLDLAYRSIQKNSACQHEILIFFNEFDNQAKKWLKDKSVKYDYDENNLGICKAVNRIAKMASESYLCYLNDDMYVLPDWDSAFQPYLDISDKIWLSGTVIEPGKASKCYISFQDYGDCPENFRENDLLSEYCKLKQPYNKISTWTPTIIPKDNWEAIGGLDKNYFPGFGSDPDLAMKMYNYGCRHFIGVCSSLVYHFSRSTTKRFDKESGTDTRSYFKMKWVISRGYFLRKMIYRDEIITENLIKKISK